jgi:chaperonin GroEL
MPQRRIQPVVFQPATHKGIQRGINQIVSAIRPTLGPRPRCVAIDKEARGDVELLDDGGVIARRIIQLPDRDDDIGAMLIRQMLWQLRENAGDGTATAAVLFQTIFNEGLRYVTAGGNAQRLRYYLERGMAVILDELSGMARPVEGKAQLGQIAHSICYDAELAGMLGEIFDIIGEYGRLDLRKGRGRELVREYVEGMYWDQGLVSREMVTDRAAQHTLFEEAAILISDLEFENPRYLMPALLHAHEAGFRALLVVAQKLSDSVKAFLIANNNPEKMRLAAVKTPGVGEDQFGALQDLAALAGGRPFIRAAGDTLKHLRADDLGRARRVWADMRMFGIVGGKGDPRALRRHIADLRGAFNQTGQKDARRKLQARIGKLMGGSATLWVGGVMDREIEMRKDRTERTAEVLRGALREGVVPGGGVSLLNCRPALTERLAQSTGPDEQAAFRILLKALEAPARTIIANAGHDASTVMAEVAAAGRGFGFDVAAGQITDMADAGIYDVAAVQKAAVHSAVASAALALTIDVVVHHKKPATSTHP